MPLPVVEEAVQKLIEGTIGGGFVAGGFSESEAEVDEFEVFSVRPSAWGGRWRVSLGWLGERQRRTGLGAFVMGTGGACESLAARPG